MILKYLVNLILTIIIEYAFLTVFTGKRVAGKKVGLFVIAMNLVTNPLVNLVFTLTDQVTIAEVSAIILESIFIKKLLGFKAFSALFTSIAMNLSSLFLGGFVLSYFYNIIDILTNKPVYLEQRNIVPNSVISL